MAREHCSSIRQNTYHLLFALPSNGQVIITAAIIATFGMLVFAQQQRQTGNAQVGTPQMQAQLQQQDASCPNGGEFVEDATRTQTRAQAHDPANAPEGAPRQVQQQLRDPSTHE